MEILSQELQSSLDRGVPVKLNLGSGGNAHELNDYYEVDLLPIEGVAVVADLNKPLDLLPDESVSHIYSRHCLEHIENIMGLMQELHRVMTPDGVAEIIVPHFSNPYYYSDPTHASFFGLYTMYYFCDSEDQPSRKVPAFYTDIRFVVEEVRISLGPRGWLRRLVFPKLGSRINRSLKMLEWYERSLCWLFPASEIRYVLRKKPRATM